MYITADLQVRNTTQGGIFWPAGVKVSHLFESAPGNFGGFLKMSFGSPRLATGKRPATIPKGKSAK